jgi:hypothetical protein
MDVCVALINISLRAVALYFKHLLFLNEIVFARLLWRGAIILCASMQWVKDTHLSILNEC